MTTGNDNRFTTTSALPAADGLADAVPADVMQFPMAFPIKVMGKHDPAFAGAVVDVVRRHAPDFDAATLETRASSNGNYLSVTATIQAQSRAQLDALYLELTGHPMVKIAL